jgi:hypothetical protein
MEIPLNWALSLRAVRPLAHSKSVIVDSASEVLGILGSMLASLYTRAVQPEWLVYNGGVGLQKVPRFSQTQTPLLPLKSSRSAKRHPNNHVCDF